MADRVGKDPSRVERIAAGFAEAEGGYRDDQERVGQELRYWEGADDSRFKLQNQLAEMEPKVRHIEDYEIRMKQLTDSQALWRVYALCQAGSS